MPSGPPLNFANFSGGLNVRDAPDLIADEQARDLMNVQGIVAGAIVKRTGLQTMLNSSLGMTAPWTSLFGIEQSFGANRYLIGADSSKLYSLTISGVATTLASSMTANPWEFITAPAVGGQGPVYGMNGGNAMQWTGSGAAAAWTATDAGGTLPLGKYCLYFNGQAIVAGVAAFPSRVYWSALKDPTGWNSANLAGAGNADFDPQDGQAITGIGIVGPYILVFKPRKMWVIVETGGPTIRPIGTGVGCSSHRSIASGPQGTYFLAEDRGVYVTNGSTVQPVSDLVRPLLDSIPGGNRNQSAGACFGGHYYLTVLIPGSPTSNWITLDYDELLKSWWKHSFGERQFAIWHPNVGQPANLYGANAFNIAVDQCFTPNTYQDHETVNYSWYWKGPWQSPSFYRRRLYPSTWYRKRLRQIRLQGDGTVDYSLGKDFDKNGVTEVLIRSNVFPSADLNQISPIFSLGVARAFSQVFSATSNTEDRVFGYTLALTDRVDRWD
jgi:hypothetical protein